MHTHLEDEILRANILIRTGKLISDHSAAKDCVVDILSQRASSLGTDPQDVVRALGMQESSEVMRCCYHDQRATDNAWVEAIVLHFHDENNRGAGRLLSDPATPSQGLNASQRTPLLRHRSAVKSSGNLLPCEDPAWRFDWHMVHSRVQMGPSRKQILCRITTELNAFW